MSSKPTQLATPSAKSCVPWLSPELISLILVELWERPYTPQDRSALLVKVALVNRTWLTLIAHITTLDVHLSSLKETMAFLQLLPRSCPIRECRSLLTMEKERVANQSCRSLTCHLDGRVWQNLSADNAPVALSVVFRDLSLPVPHLPNLRRISISHTDWAPNHIFQDFYHGFPPHVTHLSLDYSFTPAADIPPFDPTSASWWISMYQHNPRMGPCACAPNLRHIALSGVPTAFAALILDVCPNVETLELTRPGQHLSDLAPLPPATRTLVLRYPGVVLSKSKMTAWSLSEALDEGLFPPGADLTSTSESTPPRIVIRSGTPDPVSFIELRSSCKRFGVELVYEREDARSPSW